MNISNKQAWTGPFVWNGAQLAQAADWIVELSAEHVQNIHAGIEAAIASGKAMAELDQSDFPFGDFGNRLTAVQQQLLSGRGFVLIRGLPASDWTDKQLMMAYWGIGRWIGTPVPQNAKAHLLGHVIDQRKEQSGNTRIYQTNQAQPFHSDSCDIVGLLCLRNAKQGGESAVASSAAIHNALLQSDPEALDTLYGTFLCDRYGETPAGKHPFYPVNVFNKIDEQLVCCGMDPDIRSAQRLDEVAPLTEQQLHALDSFQTHAQQLALPMSLQRGDIQLANNLVVVHARASFVDHEELDERRHLIRLWLSAANGRRLPAFLSERWGTIEVGAVRGGIKVPGATPTVQMSPNS